MTLAAGLLNVPHDDQSWDIWSFTLAQNVRECNQAIRSQLNVALPDIQIYPIPVSDVQQWLLQVGMAVGNITGVLRLQTVDIENVDLSDDHERQSWVFSIFQEVRDARAALKI